MWFTIYLGLVLVCLVLNILYIKYLPIYFKYFIYLFSLILFIESIQEIFPKYKKQLNVLDHLYQPVEFIIYSIIYYNILQAKNKNIIIKYIAIIYTFIAMYLSFYFEGIEKFNTISFLLSSFILIVYSVLYFFQIIKSNNLEFPLKTTFFYINLGILIYCTSTFFQMGMHNIVAEKNSEANKMLNYISYFSNYIMYILFIVGFTKAEKNQSIND